MNPRIPKTRSTWSGQTGVALLELAVVLAISSLLAVWSAQRWMEAVDDARIRATASWLAELRHGVQRMLVADFDALSRPGLPTGLPYGDVWSPTVQELRGAGHVSSTFPLRSPRGDVAHIGLWRTACPGAHCRLDALVWLDPPWQADRGGQMDVMRIGMLRLAGAGVVGAVYAEQPERIRAGHFMLPNPPAPGLPMLPVGTVAAWAGMDASDQQYVRLHDRRDPDLRGALSVAGPASVGGSLLIGAGAAVGQACSPSGLLALDGVGQLLNCVRGVWRQPGQNDHFGGAYYQPAARSCSREPSANEVNPLTGRCTCPPGFRTIRSNEGFGWTAVCVR